MNTNKIRQNKTPVTLPEFPFWWGPFIGLNSWQRRQDEHDEHDEHDEQDRQDEHDVHDGLPSRKRSQRKPSQMAQ